MKFGTQYSDKDVARTEIRQFVFEGLQELKEGKLLEANPVFDDLEKRYMNIEMDIEEKELHQLLLSGMQDVDAGRVFDFEDVFNEMENI